MGVLGVYPFQRLVYQSTLLPQLKRGLWSLGSSSQHFKLVQVNLSLRGRTP